MTTRDTRDIPAQAPGILPDDSMEEAGRKIIRYHFERMLGHEQGTRVGQDIEELHDMRVATRRMRSALRVLSPYYQQTTLRPLRKGLRRTGRILGAVRDLDILMLKTGRYVAGLPKHQGASLAPLLIRWREDRAVAQATLVAYLDSDRYCGFVGTVRTFVGAAVLGSPRVRSDQPGSETVRREVPSLVRASYHAVCGFSHRGEHSPIETLHRLRIECKRLRYLIEFFAEVLSPDAEQLRKEIIALQDHLGALVDADVATRRLIDFLDEWRRQEERASVDIRGVTRYLAATYEEMHDLLGTFPGAWEHFCRPQLDDLLERSLAVLST